MIIIDIISDTNKIKVNEFIFLHFSEKSFNKNNEINIFRSINDNYKNKIKIKVVEFLGKGSFGCVYKIQYLNTYFAIKFSTNEIPEKLISRYNSLVKNKKLSSYFINFFCCGKLHKNKNYKYYSIMEFGGYNLKIQNCIYDRIILYKIVWQLVFIVYNIIKYRVILTDFKLGNLTLDDNYNVKIIDYYLECDNYDTYEGCKIIKTYAPIELHKYSKIFENKDINYNFSYICLPFIISMIDLLCKYKLSLYLEKLSKKFSIKSENKEIIDMLQISSFYYNSSDKSVNFDYSKNIILYINMLKDKCPSIKTKEFYEYFINLIKIKEEYSHFIKREQFLLLLNDFINLDPQKRDLSMMFELVKLIKIKNKK